MEIPGFLDYNSEEGSYRHEPSSNETRKSYVDNMVRVFSANQGIEKAYFALLYNQETDRSDLFLAVEHGEGVKEVAEMAEIVRQTFMPGKEVFFTSPSFQPELFEYISAHNFAFYVKNEPQLLNVAIMNQWFDPARYKKDFLFQVKNSKIASLFIDFDPKSNALNFQTFVRDGKQFIPLFSDNDMVYKSGMTQVPPDLTVMGFEWSKIESATDHGLRSHFYVLNPGTSFEVEFNA